ncbi:hypothetical protein [Streptomyces sp. NPDC088812]|uniref:hypothetical protein n=1 Tax=Streptomyces sp. NPDC088812 TaxID=3365905 RepID=UPI003826733E
MSVTALWPTPVHTGLLSEDDLTRLTPDPALLAGLLPEHHRARDLAWSSRIETWDEGFHAALRHGTGEWFALVVLGARVRERSGSEASGALVLHDPRAGAANVALPGLPWGRPITVPTITGTLVLVPGWLAWQIAPVHADEQRTVLTANTP